MSRLLEIATPLGKDQVILSHFSGQEELGRLPRFNLTLVTKRGDVKASDLLGKNVTAGIEMPGGQKLRYFNGYVTQFADAGHTPAARFVEGGKGQAFIYQATMHPWLWFLTRSSNFRIFQDKTVPQVIQAVCAVYPFAYLELRLTGNYTPWEYCCQYRETDFNFISRLMEQMGIYYYFEHVDGKHTMILCDDLSKHSARPGYTAIPFSDVASGRSAEKECITEWHASHEIQPGRFTIKDFDFQKPKADLTAKSSISEDHEMFNFEYYDYPGEYETTDEGDRLSKVRIQELHSNFQVVSASGPIRGIETGRTFKLSDHPQVAEGSEFLVTTAHYDFTNNGPESGDTHAEFRCSFNTIPATTQFRPVRSTSKPIVPGPQTAIVVGPAGEEIHVDKYGRVKVQFHWDRYNQADDKSSCWVRVSQPWASKQWGAIFLPRIGHEVIIEFIDGDPDWPIITGRVYNAESMPPWDLPGQKTRSGIKTRTYKGSASNFNELSFDDKQGSEEIYIHAEKDKNVRIKNRRREYVGEESHRIIEKDYREKTNADHHVTIKGDENVKLDEGSFSLNVAQHWQGKMGGMILADAGAEIHLKSAASIFNKAAKNIDSKAEEHIRFKSDQNTQMKVGMNMAVDAAQEIHLKGGMNVVIEAGMSITLKAGGGFIVVGPAGVTISGTPVLINSGGSAGSGSGCTPPEDGTACNPTAPKAPDEARGSKGGEDMKPEAPPKPEDYSPQAQALKLAWQAGTPFCAQCAAAAAAAAASDE
ncbi:MAG: type VI secretion system tip protein TssI/VgrG [Rhodocyclaceae bacterium]|nr:type VI secretion system tip protein TssI/VgrG [Rhodocyclaceae bacterium]